MGIINVILIVIGVAAIVTLSVLLVKCKRRNEKFIPRASERSIPDSACSRCGTGEDGYCKCWQGENAVCQGTNKTCYKECCAQPPIPTPTPTPVLTPSGCVSCNCGYYHPDRTTPYSGCVQAGELSGRPDGHYPTPGAIPHDSSGQVLRDYVDLTCYDPSTTNGEYIYKDFGGDLPTSGCAYSLNGAYDPPLSIGWAPLNECCLDDCELCVCDKIDDSGRYTGCKRRTADSNEGPLPKPYRKSGSSSPRQPPVPCDAPFNAKPPLPIGDEKCKPGWITNKFAGQAGAYCCVGSDSDSDADAKAACEESGTKYANYTTLYVNKDTTGGDAACIYIPRLNCGINKDKDTNHCQGTSPLCKYLTDKTVCDRQAVCNWRPYEYRGYGKCRNDVLEPFSKKVVSKTPVPNTIIRYGNIDLIKINGRNGTVTYYDEEKQNKKRIQYLFGNYNYSKKVRAGERYYPGGSLWITFYDSDGSNAIDIKFKLIEETYYLYNKTIDRNYSAHSV